MKFGEELSVQSGVLCLRFSWVFARGCVPCDMDVSAVCFDSAGDLSDAVFYNQKSAMDGAIRHSGDRLSKSSIDSPGPDKRGRLFSNTMGEEVIINLTECDGISVIVFMLSAFSGGSLRDCDGISSGLLIFYGSASSITILN
jgi:hypothetical protein